MRPVIAMPRLSRDLFRRYMTSKYIMSLVCSGAKIQWIHMERLDEEMEALLACDGLLLPGGADIDPARYGQPVSPKCGKIDGNRDEGEFRMMAAFYPTGKPILGICRGEQLMNVFFGGTLYQDIKETQKCLHDVFSKKNLGNHRVSLTRGTIISDIFGCEQLRVNSLHHQAVDIPGEGLRVSAVSEDGFVEAVEKADHLFCLGVQWHPEHMFPFSRKQRRIFRAFLNACKNSNKQ